MCLPFTTLDARFVSLFLCVSNDDSNSSSTAACVYVLLLLLFPILGHFFVVERGGGMLELYVIVEIDSVALVLQCFLSAFSIWDCCLFIRVFVLLLLLLVFFPLFFFGILVPVSISFVFDFHNDLCWCC